MAAPSTGGYSLLMTIHPIRQLILDAARACEGLHGPQPWAAEAGVKGAVSPEVHWCALFVSAILRRVGLQTPDWQIGSSILTQSLSRVPGAVLALPADIGYIARGGHHAFVVEDNGRTVTSIDGNGPGRIVVVDRIRPRSDYTAFYSIGNLWQ